VPRQSAADSARTTPQLVRRGFPTTSPDQCEVPSPDRQWFATEREFNLWLRSAADGRAAELTTGGGPRTPWRVTGARWAPDGLTLAAIKLDTRAQRELPIVHWLKPAEEVEWVPYTRVGGAMQRSELYLIDVLRRQPIRVRLDSADAMLSLIGWVSGDAELLFYRMSRDFKQLDLLTADRRTGATRTVLTERQPTFIKGITSNPGWSELCTLLPDGNRFLWISERDGWDHLYLYSLDGTLLHRLTTGSFPVLRVVSIDEPNGWVYFTAHAEPILYDTHLYRVRLDGTGFQRLTDGTGTHSVAFSPSKAFFLDTHSNVDRAPTVELRSADGRLVRVMSRANIDSLRALGWRPPEEFIVKAADGVTDLYGVLYKPSDFDSTRRYPVIEYIYAGPHPVGDLYDHAALPTEGYMDLLHRNPEGYAHASSLRHAESLRGKLMLLHGTSDLNAPFSSTMKLVDALTRAGKPYDLRVFPELNRGLTGVVDYWYETHRRYFLEHLKP